MKLVSQVVCGVLIAFGGLAAAQETPAVPDHPQVRGGISARQAQGAANGRMSRPSPAVQQHPAPAATPKPDMVTAPKKDPQLAEGGAQQPAAEPSPLKPIKPSEMPPMPPHVVYRDGLLTVNAVNSTLSSLLQAIRSKTGIEFEGAEGVTDRVAISLGPAPEGEVLSGIFTGSNFDYLVIGRADSPGVVQRVILTPHKGAVISTAPVAQAQPAEQPEGEEEVPDELAGDPPDPQDTAAQPPPQPANPASTPQAQAQPQTKTPEQYLEELKRLEQQRQGQTPNPNLVPRKPPL